MFAWWWWFTAAVVNKMASQELLFAPNWLILGPAITALFLLWRTRNYWRVGWGWWQVGWFAWFLVYWLFFPVAVINLVVWYARVILGPVSGALRVAIWPTTNLGAVLVFLPLLIVSWLGLLVAERPGVITGLIIAEVVLNTILLAVGLRWASNPMYPFLGLVSIVLWLQGKLDDIHQRYPPVFANDCPFRDFIVVRRRLG